MKKTIIAAILIASIGAANAQLNIQYNYLVPTSSQKASYDKLLFPKNGSSIGLSYSFLSSKSNFGVLLQVDYFTLKNDAASVAAYAKSKDIVYSTYKFTQAKAKGFAAMTGLIYHLPHASETSLLAGIELKAGALFSNGQSMQYYNGQNQKIKEVTATKTSFVWNPNVYLDISVSKNIAFKVNAGYSSITGLNAGLGVLVPVSTTGKRGYHCSKCGIYVTAGGHINGQTH